MRKVLTCFVMGGSFDEFTIVVADKILIDNSSVSINDFTVGLLKKHIWKERSKKFADSGIEPNDLSLWKAEIPVSEGNYQILENSEIEHVIQAFSLKKLRPGDMFLDEEVFSDEYTPPRSHIHIIIQPRPTTSAQQGPDWTDASSIYEWIKQVFILNRGRNRLVESFGATFELFQREDTINTLWNGNPSEQLNGIVNRFEVRKSGDKTGNPIPVLAGGPGIGKSRFLDEIEILLKKCVKGSSNKDLCDAIANMVVINVSYGNGSSTDTIDLNVGGPASLAIRILFEYFRPHYNYGAITSSQFRSHCNKFSTISNLTLDTALRVIYTDMINMKQITYNSLLTIVLGIDEFNKLHEISKEKSKLLINSIGTTMVKSPANIFFVPVLAGTVEGPLEQYISGSMHQPLPLPLCLIEDEDSIKIGKSLNLFDDEYVICHPYFRIGIGDIGGHVKTLEYFYHKFSEYLKQYEGNPYQVKIEDVMISVKCTVESKYQLSLNSKWLTEPLAKAILGIPVDKYDVIKLDKGEMSYQELSSMGVVNLVKKKTKKKETHYQIRLPYLWASILVQKSRNSGMNYWKSMFDYDEPMYWQKFEDFNAKFWALRLSLFHLLGYRKIKLGELLRGAIFSRGFPNEVEVILPKDIKLCKLQHRYPAAETNDKKNMNEMEVSLRCYTSLDCLRNENVENEKYMDCVFLNTPGAPWDVFGFLKYPINYESSESSETGILCVVQQVKYTNIEALEPMIIKQDLFNDEYEKVSEAIKGVPVGKWALLFLTNADAKDNLTIKCKKNSALVSRKQFQEFYGYTYANRAQFASANEKIYINSAPSETLKILGFTDNQCNDIGSKRPFSSLDDMMVKLDISDNKFKKLKRDDRITF